MRGAVQTSIKMASTVLWGSLCLGERDIDVLLPVLGAVQQLKPSKHALRAAKDKHLQRLHLALVACNAMHVFDMFPLLHPGLRRAMHLAETHPPVRPHPWISPRRGDSSDGPVVHAAGAAAGGAGGRTAGGAGGGLGPRRSVALDVARALRGTSVTMGNSDGAANR